MASNLDASWQVDTLNFMNNNSSPYCFRTAWTYFLRSLKLRCPTCGITPIFPSLKKTRSLRDWFTPLDGCHRCGYPYEREPGYFLLATWAGSYGMGSLIGLIFYFTLDLKFHPPIFYLLLMVLIPVILANIILARHAKSFFLAFDHFFDPHEKATGNNDDDRNQRPKKPFPISPEPHHCKRPLSNIEMLKR